MLGACLLVLLQTVKHETVWTHAVKDGAGATPEQIRAFDALLKAAAEEREKGPRAWTNEPSPDGKQGPTFRRHREREAVTGGGLPDLVKDEAGWNRLLKLFEEGLKLDAEPLAALKRIRPDFSKEMLVVVHLHSASGPGSRSTASFKAIVEEKETLRVRLEIQGGSGGAAFQTPPGYRPSRDQTVQILKLEKSAKKVVVREDRSDTMYP